MLGTSSGIFAPFQLKRVRFKHRVLRSSIGGRTAYYDGTVNNAWGNFELRFAAPDGFQEDGVAGIISATLTVDPERLSPLEYPSISHDRYVAPLARFIREIQKRDCRYLIQIGDPGYQTQTSLFSEPQDEVSASNGIDLMYGYRNKSRALRREEIPPIVNNFAEAARRVRETGAAGLEITASKGYLIHQFLNPGSNRRKDEYGGDLRGRFRFLEEVVTACRRAVGDDYLLGVRLSARDRNYLPMFNLRWPPTWWGGRNWHGNRLEEMLVVGQWLKELGVDYLHISNGFGFINPYETPGRFPTSYVRRYAASTAHLSAKARVRSWVLGPDWLMNFTWGADPHVNNLEDALRFKRRLQMPVIANGGLHTKAQVETALNECELVSMARPLLAEPHLLRHFRDDVAPAKPCTRCNNCTVATTMYPLGCYEPARFESTADMQRQILEWSGNPADPLDSRATAP
jgi:2,4-dienoyl-CoA reductase-like NADH-dependent reductase (Old Yellow Enzyme family)